MDIKTYREKIEKAEVLAGGRFKLTTLLQKRVQELVRGAERLVKIKSNNPIHVAMEEILEEKISLEDK